MSTELQKDIENLKKDLSKFRDDITSVLADVGHYSQDNIHEAREKLKTAMKDFEGVTATKISHANEFLHEKTGQAVDTSRDIVARRPITAVMVSFAAGALTAYLLKNHNHG
jgi:ElaB/YqjD/DUF883 family membrane-anchored ribosome-binding protein